MLIKITAVLFILVTGQYVHGGIMDSSTATVQYADAPGDSVRPVPQCLSDNDKLVNLNAKPQGNGVLSHKRTYG